eukprot:TRINITY_DN16792_c0_g1_i1.p1 TRINITY_DN16792_c0_g1~~TRINITY_DN16792_c0_g1_i1.p1  ORF type:complete len:572 (+),score=86.07 TRINITY_DN16792_c0_g1_i1:105-1820(+)
MPKALSARSASPKKKQASEDAAKGLNFQFNSASSKRRIFSEARRNFSKLYTDAGVEELPGWLAELRHEHQANTEETSSKNRSLKSAAGILRMSVRHTMQERHIASLLGGGGDIRKDKNSVMDEKAKIEALLKRLENVVGVDGQDENPVESLKDVFEELQRSMDPAQFATSVEEIRIMLDRLHVLEATFDELSADSTMAKITEALEKIKSQVPHVISHVREETERVWSKARRFKHAHRFTRTMQKLTTENRLREKEDQADTTDVHKEEELSKSDRQKAMIKTALSTSESWSKIADESAWLKSRGPESGTWLTWWPDRDPEGYKEKRQFEFFESQPPDSLSQQEEDLRDAIFSVISRVDKNWPSLEEVARDEHVRLCMNRCLPDFVSLGEWILKRRQVGQPGPRFLQAGWSKMDNHEEGAPANTSPRRTVCADRPMSARRATMQRARTRRALGLQVAMTELGDLCCSLEGTDRLPSITTRLLEQKSFNWIKALEVTQRMPCRPTPAGLPTVEEVVAWRVSHKYRRNQVDPSLTNMWQTYDTIIDPGHMHQCPCEKCQGRLHYEIPSSSLDLFS